MEKQNQQLERFLAAFFCLVIAIAASVCEWASHPRRGFRIIVPVTPDELAEEDE